VRVRDDFYESKTLDSRWTVVILYQNHFYIMHDEITVKSNLNESSLGIAIKKKGWGLSCVWERICTTVACRDRDGSFQN